MASADRKIDYDRGVMIKVHNVTGMDIFMYMAEPGIYLNAFGTPVAEDLAAAAGYDIVKYGKERQRREKMKLAMSAIDAELQLADEISKDEELVVMERNGFKIIDIGLGRRIVKDPDGGILTVNPVPEELAMKLFDQLVPPAEQKKAEKK